MKMMKGPGIFLARFLRDEPPWDNLENIAGWVANLGYKGVQIPTSDARVIDLDKAARSKGYCDDLKGRLRSIGLEITELTAHLQGQVDFKRVFTLLTEAGYEGWAVLEWECCIKSPDQGALEGAMFIAQHIIEATAVAFDDFAGGKTDVATNRRILGLR